ncbi:MAG TPA: nicotinate-nucleotide adenylyltransferase [Pyrinomonadaceae bacterium]
MDATLRIGLYGGTFDPVHIGHTAVAHALLKLFALDRVFFIPAYVAPHKRDTGVTPALHRYAMLALSTQFDTRLAVSTVEIDAPERPYTYETLSRLQSSFGRGAQLFFLMGADSWAEITTWREWERVLASSNHIVMARPGYEWGADHVTPAIRERIIDLRGAGEAEARRAVGESEDLKIYLTDAVNMDVSATTIRSLRRDGRDDWVKLVSPAVADYIRKYGLYSKA